MAAARKSGLGRGLESLIPVTRPEHGFTTIPVDRIEANPRQPRDHFEAEGLESLAASIREVGILQPVIVQGNDEAGYTLIAGERRWRAARMAGLDEIPAVVRTTDEQGSLVEALVENLQREDLRPLEEAAAFQELAGSGLSHEDIARRVGKSRSAVTNTLRLLDLPPAVQGLLDRGQLSAGHARALLGLEDRAYAVHIAGRAAAEGWSVRAVEEAVKARREQAAPRAPVARPERPAEIIALEERLGEFLGAAVKIDYRGRGGRVVVRFKSLGDLERIYRRFYDG